MVLLYSLMNSAIFQPDVLAQVGFSVSSESLK